MYNGWANKETWTTFTWIGNDSVTWSLARQAAQEGKEALYDFIREDVLDLHARPPADLAWDLLQDAVDRIDFDALRDALLDDGEGV